MKSILDYMQSSAAPPISKLRIVLASASPRRVEILKMMNLEFQVIPSTFPETLSHGDFPVAEDYVMENAKQKAWEVARRPDVQASADIVIGSDTVVVLDGQILEKPASEAQAFSMLNSLSGRWHNVITAVAIYIRKMESGSGRGSGSELVLGKLFAETARVQFSELDERTIWGYIETGEPMDKAGSYGIQGLGGALVQRVDGCFFCVMGLPMHRFARELVDLLDNNAG